MGGPHGEVPVVQVLFRAASRRTRRASCPRSGLSSDLCREVCGGLPGVDVVVAVGADYEGLFGVVVP